jgi:hypothetical protein
MIGVEPKRLKLARRVPRNALNLTDHVRCIGKGLCRLVARTNRGSRAQGAIYTVERPRRGAPIAIGDALHLPGRHFEMLGHHVWRRSWRRGEPVCQSPICPLMGQRNGFHPCSEKPVRQFCHLVQLGAFGHRCLKLLDGGPQNKRGIFRLIRKPMCILGDHPPHPAGVSRAPKSMVGPIMPNRWWR